MDFKETDVRDVIERVIDYEYKKLNKMEVLGDKIEKVLRKLMDENNYKVNALQLQEWLIDARKLETDGFNHHQQIINAQHKEIVALNYELYKIKDFLKKEWSSFEYKEFEQIIGL